MYLDAYLKGEIPQEIFTELKKYNCLFDYTQEDLDCIKENQIDLLGVDYYFPIRVKARYTEYKGLFSSRVYYEDYIWSEREYNADRGWETYPKAIFDVGMRIKKEYGNKDWFVSENGIGIEGEERYRNKEGQIEDDYRIDFIKRHLSYTIEAYEKGCNCHGYLIWSFVDNVSAINSFKNRYGLLELDLKTYQRKPKKTKEIIGVFKDLSRTRLFEVEKSTSFLYFIVMSLFLSRKTIEKSCFLKFLQLFCQF